MLKAGALGERSYEDVEPFANVWHTWSSWAYLKGYLDAAGKAPFVPKSHDELKVLVDAFRLEKALWELEHDFYHRPESAPCSDERHLKSDWRTRPMNEPKMMGAEPLSGQRTRFRVWAPKARQMSVKIVAPESTALDHRAGRGNISRSSRRM